MENNTLNEIAQAVIFGFYYDTAYAWPDYASPIGNGKMHLRTLFEVETL